jgi:uncharacterized protein YjiS (DUF1127 family)
MAIANALLRVGPFAGSVGRTAAAPRAAPASVLLARYSAWLRRRIDAARLRELDPHLAHDIGITPAGGGHREGFVVDPRPLWGLGLTPQPTEVSPPWSGDRHRGG